MRLRPCCGRTPHLTILHALHTDLCLGTNSTHPDLCHLPPRCLGRLTYNNRLSGILPTTLDTLTGLSTCALTNSQAKAAGLPTAYGVSVDTNAFACPLPTLPSACRKPAITCVHQPPALPPPSVSPSLPPAASVEDKKALVALYHAAHGAGWSGNSGWNVANASSAPCDGSSSSWHGVTCNSGSVTDLCVRGGLARHMQLFEGGGRGGKERGERVGVHGMQRLGFALPARTLPFGLKPLLHLTSPVRLSRRH